MKTCCICRVCTLNRDLKRAGITQNQLEAFMNYHFMLEADSIENKEPGASKYESLFNFENAIKIAREL